MQERRIKKYIRYLYGIAAVAFILNKFYLKPWILENKTPDIFLIVTNSIPNFIEAIIGTLMLTGILFGVRQYFNKKFGSINDTSIHLIAVSIASIYVISQELKIHNLGGNNVYDPYDIVASSFGG